LFQLQPIREAQDGAVILAAVAAWGVAVQLTWRLARQLERATWRATAGAPAAPELVLPPPVLAD
jgi:hypothetical protein